MISINYHDMNVGYDIINKILYKLDCFGFLSSFQINKILNISIDLSIYDVISSNIISIKIYTHHSKILNYRADSFLVIRGPSIKYKCAVHILRSKTFLHLGSVSLYVNQVNKQFIRVVC